MTLLKTLIMGLFLLALGACSPEEGAYGQQNQPGEGLTIIVDEEIPGQDSLDYGEPGVLDLDQTVKAKVVDVVDGDTLKVDLNGELETVRLLLVDTPETVHPRKEVQPFGPEASRFVRDWLLDEEVLLEKDINLYDKYNRLLFYVYDLEGTSLQEELLRHGLARVAYVYPPNVKYVDRYREIQDEAQVAGRGIWSIEDYALEESQAAEETSQEAEDPPRSQGLIKGNINSKGEKIYHMPGQQHYNQTQINPEKGERFFETEEEALEAGWRKAKR